MLTYFITDGKGLPLHLRKGVTLHAGLDYLTFATHIFICQTPILQRLQMNKC